MTGFDLVHERWIPATAGAAEEVSLLDALTRAHELDGLGIEDPLGTVAVLRQVLLPVVLDALGAPRSDDQWFAWWEAGRFDADRLAEYLDEHADRFDLFHPTVPFAQVAGLRTAKDETKPSSVLLPSVATGNNVPLFTSRTEADPPLLTAAEAARALLSAHCWDTAAIKSGAVGDPRVKAGKTTGNPTGPVGGLGVVIPLGQTLAQTLLLNLPVVPQGLRAQDRPQWRAEPATAKWSTRATTGLLDLLTFQSRRIRLLPEPSEHPMVVSRVVLAAGDRLDHYPDYEPHTLWRTQKKPKPGTAARRPVRHQPGKAAWRGMSSLLATSAPTRQDVSSSLLLSQIAALRAEDYLPVDLPLQVLTVGIAYGNQSAVVEDTLLDLVPVPVLALTAAAPMRGLLKQIVNEAESLRRAGNDLADDIRRASGGEKLPWDRGLRVGDALMHQLTPTVHRLLAGLQREPDRLDDAEDAWHDVARRLALQAGEQVLASAPPQAFLGRRDADTDHVHRLSVADANYRRAIYAILPPARADSPTWHPDPAGATA